MGGGWHGKERKEGGNMGMVLDYSIEPYREKEGKGGLQERKRERGIGSRERERTVYIHFWGRIGPGGDEKK